MAFLQMQGVSKTFGATIALDDVNLTAEPGEVHALVGENGSGKSTLMRVLAGALKADSGEMSLEGQPYRPSNPLEARLAGVAMIYQELALCPDLSAAENILLGLEVHTGGVIDKAESRRRAQDALSQLGYPELNVDEPVKVFPIGVCQIIEIARAVALGSKVVVLDEPTSSLSQPDVERLFAVINALRSSGHAIIYISHFLDEIERIADRVTVLRDGRHISTQAADELNADAMVSLMVGRQIDEIYPHSQREPSEAILEVEGLQGLRKPMSASIKLRRGEVLGIGGLNGSGRTELLRCLFGLDKVKSGQIKLGGFSGAARPARRWSEGMGLLSEDRKSEGLALGMSIADNMMLTKLDPLISNSRQSLTAQSWIDKVGVKCQGPRQTIGELSGGNQQKVAFARLLYSDVDVLLLDEPTRGIDVGSKEQIYAMIDELARSGKALIMVSSYLPELLGVCDRIAVMHKGVLGDARPTRELNQESIMREAAGV